MRFGTGKDAQAICFNIKEQRMLEKTDSTLKLEKEYAMKLIELSSREVKIHQRRLKTKVGKIKSHLSVEEIKEFREQEHEGRFGPKINTVNVSGAFTISAAERRLKLTKERRLAAHGCNPDGSKAITTKAYQRQQSERMSKQVPARHISRNGSTSCYTDTPPLTPATPRATSVRLAFHFRDAGEGSAEDISTIPDAPKTPKSARSVPGGMTASVDFVDGVNASRRPRPATSVGPRRERVKNPPRCKSSVGYSSHEAIEKEEREKERSESNGGRRMTKTQSFLSDGSIDGAIAKGRLEERRQTLLDIEQLQALQLLDRKQDFLIRVNHWIKENPSTNQEDPHMSKIMTVLSKDSSPTGNSPSAKDAKGKGKKKLVTRNSFSGPSQIRQRQEGPVEVKWQDLNKCRYLRIAEEDIDLSGVVTLAKAQTQMHKAFRQIDDDNNA